MRINDIITEDHQPKRLSPMKILRGHRDKEGQLARQREEFLSVEQRWREFLERLRRQRHIKALWQEKLRSYRRAIADGTVEEYLSRL